MHRKGRSEALEAGVAKGSVSLSFDSRDALLVAAFEGYAAQAHLLPEDAER
ncbi:hypothetical protein [Streptomyces sp. NPDC055886]